MVSNAGKINQLRKHWVVFNRHQTETGRENLSLTKNKHSFFWGGGLTTEKKNLELKYVGEKKSNVCFRFQLHNLFLRCALMNTTLVYFLCREQNMMFCAFAKFNVSLFGLSE